MTTHIDIDLVCSMCGEIRDRWLFVPSDKPMPDFGVILACSECGDNSQDFYRTELTPSD